MKQIPLNIISKKLDIRPVRLVKKIQELNLDFFVESDVRMLSRPDVFSLASAYVTSGRVSERTRNLAHDLLLELESESDFKSIKSPKSTSNKKRKPITIESESQKIMPTPNRKRSIEEYGIALTSAIRLLVDLGINMMTSSQFKFVALMIAIGVQMQHSAAWFFRLSAVESVSWSTAYAYAFMVDLFILVVTMEGKLSIAKTFAVLTFFANVLYFQFWVDFDGSLQAYTNAVSCLMVSGIIAYIIYSYTEIFVKFQS